MLSGFKNFLLRGNLVDLAVAVIIGTAFGAVVATFTNWLTAQLPESASEYFTNEPNTFGAFLNAVISFVILAAVVYFFVVMPYTKAKERYFPSAPAGTPEDIKLLQEIRDLIAAQRPQA
ncbi:MscL family protein [Nocardioides marmotae]|uniref:Large conductance mechanosensitive channel protein MscL n=1 Tax=Nocardioides marmotae TaxID=2663857 RepID=A0A6I3J9A6_9ACTN|nr:MscL family protein [Nocardioides marmotae]MCR6030226.1 large conductance mechanosensitive channel protein MscL [Gordonia jinghuaiqii]MBC9734483.1 MscL family protein [Nocardioides marmotae]MTB85583.1 large conductance mechanosensitive channel protein MscL [Nocardioides marmotae]MTB93858.1 large conductance mechanosensitive channel protein MscL [Nocardioides marmotae]QKE00183.1 MscL family protein [Nocardioides marmotae]